MGPEKLEPESEDAIPAVTQGVEFALVLSRIIDSVEKDPEQLRATIYELARHKLQEQFSPNSFADARRLSKSLEIAIQGVEAFHRKKEGTAAALLAPGQGKSPMLGHAARYDVAPVVQQFPPEIEVQISAPASSLTWKRHARSEVAWRFAKACAIALAVAVALGAVMFNLLGKKENVAVTNAPELILPKAVTPASQSAPSATSPPQLAQASPALPSSFGIYAVSEGKFFQLDLLPGRAPDARVAISSLITTNSRTTLPDGHLTFIVYRRDSATNAADRAEVRLVARIARELSFDKDGKRVTSEIGDNWVIRNISIPYRTAPKKDIPDMYEIRSEDPETPLAPGRYALVLKGYAYDFSVAGQVADPRQCLERLVATNGQFYSECK
jgi:hypothetical protein